MELTIEQAFQQAVTAHKEGKLQDAERFYQAILQSQPAHPEANHNLAILAVFANMIDAALPLFKTAVEANPSIDQFWLSYIDALTKKQQFEAARLVLEQAKNQGVAEEKLNALEIQIASMNAEESGDSLSPSREQLNNLLDHYQKRRFADAEKFAISITAQFPKHPFAWKVLGAIFGQTGRKFEALNANKKAVALFPQDAEVHSNLGVMLQELGKLDEAEASYTQAIRLKPNYAEAHSNLGDMFRELGRLDEAEASLRQAIVLKPDFAEAHSNLGNTLKELGKLDEAEASLRQAIVLKPDYAAAHSNLGNTLKEQSKLDEAVASYSQAIALKPDYAEAYMNLSLTIKNLKFRTSDRRLYPPLLQMLTNGNFTRPSDVAGSILSLLKLDPLIKDLMLEKNVAMSLTDATCIIKSLEKFPLLHQLMRICPLPDLQVEGFFVAMRRFLLTNLDEIEVSPDLIYFLSTLCLHCFTNEYVYFETDEETSVINELEKNIKQTVSQIEQPEIIKILCLACYRPLYQYFWCEKLETLNHLEEVKSRLVEEPHLEKLIQADIPMLGEISDDISCKVRQQYEENPYPRWVRLRIHTKPKSISDVCDNARLQLHSKSIKNVTAPDILVAGCGTGQHSIDTASHFSGCQVTAVDLSLTSLAYAQRKTAELGITNIKYLQADILRLRSIQQEFDIIESAGVLHHMHQPMVGWSILTGLLKSDGLMKIGLYSELARSHIVGIQKEVSLLELGTSEAGIREFRRSLAVSHDKNHQVLTTSSDFFSLSALRDLVFHVQEHRFTLPQIKKSLDELGLKFCGFENEDAISNFKYFYGKEANIYDLTLWHQYEKSYPSTFAGMYQFWCQKSPT